MRIFLSGPMGAGKTSAGRAMAVASDRAFFDLDEVIAARTGRSPAQAFAEQGEGAFRDAEKEALAALLATCPPTSVVALGGGTVLDESSRRTLLGKGALVTLTADVGVLARRVGDGAGRPLLATKTDVEGELRRILDARAGYYAESHASIDTSSLSPKQVADAVLAATSKLPIVVPQLTQTTRVHFQSASEGTLSSLLPDAGRALLVTDEDVHRAMPVRLGEKPSRVLLSPGESAKSLRSLDRIWDAASAAELDRRSAFIAFGGGVVGDLTGFAAATYLRGIRWVNIPTTLLAMLDSCIGGKTGIDRGVGKNIVGAFHPPSDVIVDIDLLSSLPIAELGSALGELVKTAILAGETELGWVEEHVAVLRAGEVDSLIEAVRMCLVHKARVVSTDLYDHGERRLLNLGHTFGHAIEAASAYKVRHGEAVAMGLRLALRVALQHGFADEAFVRRVDNVLDSAGLGPCPVELLRGARDYLKADKKRYGDSVDFVVPYRPGDVRVHRLPLAELAELAANLAS